MSIAFGRSSKESLEIDYVSTNIISTHDIIISGRTDSSDLAITGDISLHGTALTSENVRNLVRHCEYSPEYYITGDYNGVLPTVYEAHVSDFEQLRTDFTTLESRVDATDNTAALAQTNSSNISSIQSDILQLETNIEEHENALGKIGSLATGDNTLSHVLGDVSSWGATKSISTSIAHLEQGMSQADITFQDYKANSIGELVNSGVIGTNLAPGKTLIECIGDLDAYGESNLISQFNVTKHDIDEVQTAVTSLESDMGSVQDDIAQLKMAEGGDENSFVGLLGLIGNPYGTIPFSRDGWYPLFETFAEADVWLNSQIIDQLESAKSLALTSEDHDNLEVAIGKYVVGTIGSLQAPSPHILLDAEWSGDTDYTSTYYTIMTLDENVVSVAPSEVSYNSNYGASIRSIGRTYVGEKTSFEQNIHYNDLTSRIFVIEQDMTALRAILGPVDILQQNHTFAQAATREHSNEDTNLLYSALKTNNCHPNLFQPSALNWGYRMLFGQSREESFSRTDIEKCIEFRGEVRNNHLFTRIRNGEVSGDIVLTFMIGEIGNENQFDLALFLNSDENTQFKLEFRFAPGGEKTIHMSQSQDAISGYSLFEDSLSGAQPRNNPIHYLQLKYSTALGRFSGISSSRNFKHDAPTVSESSLCKVDKLFILDWLQLPGRRIQYKHFDDPLTQQTYNVDICGMCACFI
jgi:prefoldin subunit 5